MRTPTSQRYVLAGVDGALTDGGVLARAVDEARRRGDVLTIAHAWRGPGTGDAAVCARSRAQSVLDEAVARVRLIAPDVAVHPYPARGDPADVLLGLARSAEITVLGAGLRLTPDLGPTAERVADRAPGPVMIIRGNGHAPVRSVAVGVDPDPAGREAAALAVAFAVEEAWLHGARLEAVASYWSPGPPRPVPGRLAGAEFGARRVAAGRVLEDLVGPYIDTYPEIRMLVRVTARPPGPVLEDLTRHADLLVVGGGHGPAGRIMPGSVGHDLTRHAACPVAIVRGGPGDDRSSGAAGRLIHVAGAAPGDAVGVGNHRSGSRDGREART